MARLCPDCIVELKAENIDSISVDVCGTCAGVFFDDGELRALMETSEEMPFQVEDRFRATTEVLKTNGGRNCPACEARMEAYRFAYSSGVILDSCPVCFGIWVDDGELRAMKEALENDRAAPMDPQQRRHLERQLAIAEMKAAHDESMTRHKIFQRVIRVVGLWRYQGPWRY